MEPYESSSAKLSGVVAYEAGDDYIVVQFRNGGTYKYTYRVTGLHHVEAMKKLAVAQRGLSTYIAQHKEQLRYNRY